MELNISDDSDNDDEDDEIKEDGDDDYYKDENYDYVYDEEENDNKSNEEDYIEYDNEENYTEYDDKEEINITENINRRLDEELYNNLVINSTDYLEYEDIISDKYYQLNNIVLRQADIEENENENKNKKYKKSNLTQYSLKTLENDQISLKDSELNTVVYSNINENGFLVTIKEIQKAIMNQPTNDGIDKEDEEFINQIYSNNEISRDDASFENDIKTNLM